MKYGCLILIVVSFFSINVHAQEERRAKPVLSNKYFRPMNKAQEAIQNEDYPAALAVLDELLSRDSLTGYDRAKTFHLKTIVYIRQEHYVQAVSTAKQAIDLHALEITTEQDLRYTLVRMLLVLERYDDAVRELETWMADIDALDAEAAFTAAQLYMRVERLDKAQQYAERGMALHKTDQQGDAIAPRENWYRLLLSVYGQQKNYSRAVRVAVETLSLWPAKIEYYHQLSGLYQQLQQEKEAWAILDIAYHNQLLDTDDYLRLLQMHRYFGYPMRGAELFAKAIEQGAVEKTADNWESLANARLQARQWQLAEPALVAAANLSQTGLRWLRLCQTTFQREQWRQSLQYCNNALDQGGLEQELGPTWQLIAMVNYNINNYAAAVTYLEKCASQPPTQSDCSQRLASVNKIIEFEQVKQARAEQQAKLLEERRRNRNSLVEEAILMTKP